MTRPGTDANEEWVIYRGWRGHVGGKIFFGIRCWRSSLSFPRLGAERIPPVSRPLCVSTPLSFGEAGVSLSARVHVTLSVCVCAQAGGLCPSFSLSLSLSACVAALH